MFNMGLLHQYIDEYQNRFEEIKKQEIYKWQAVKQFKDNWNPDAHNFAEMLSRSLSKTKNLMGSGNYFPRRVIIRNAERDPQGVRTAFLNLFNEDNDDVIARIAAFRKQIKVINSREYPDTNDFQDQRAALVYLTLWYPDTFYFYKYEMFKSFCAKVELDYVPTVGADANILQFMETCAAVKEELINRNELIKLHKDRIGAEEYFDRSCNILTQDFIYAVTFYLTPGKSLEPNIQPALTFRDISLEPITKEYGKEFKGKFVDFEGKQKLGKYIGGRGEEFVYEFERAHCPPQYKDKVIRISKAEGDGTGYDILSFDQNGNKKYIEVKTTKGSAETPFYLSRTELERSKKEGRSYYLYRLYNFNENSQTAEFFQLQGDLSKYCVNPVEYEVAVKLPESI